MLFHRTDDRTPHATVLVVDDDKTTVKVLSKRLAELGYHVLSATDGDRALEVARRHTGPIQLLLTDVIMPKMNGPALAELLLVTRPEIQIVFMSGVATASAIPLSLRSRSSFIQKQHPVDGLVDIVKKAMDDGAARSV